MHPRSWRHIMEDRTLGKTEFDISAIPLGTWQVGGGSAEKVEEALQAIEYPDVTTVEIIFNMFRLRPAGLFFREARAKDVGIIARVPLASGLLSGRFNRETQFGAGDQ